MPTVAAGRWLFVAGHDPERCGRLAYRGRVGETVGPRAARAALRLATANALASARAAVGRLSRIRRCVVLTAFVDAAPGALDPRLVDPSLRLLAAVLGPGRPPAVGLRPARGLAGGMPVEVELLLELRQPVRRTAARPGPRTGAPGAAPVPPGAGDRAT